MMRTSVAATVATLALLGAGIAHGDATDDAFLIKVKAKDIHSDKGDAGLIADAHWVCAALRKPGNGGIIEVAHSIFTNHSDDTNPGFDLYSGPDAYREGAFVWAIKRRGSR